MIDTGNEILGDDVTIAPATPEVKVEPAASSGSGDAFADMLANAAKDTPKQSYSTPPKSDEPGAIPGSSTSTENPENEPEPEPDPSQQRDPQWTDDRIEAEARMHVTFFDFGMSRILAMWAKEDADKYAATEPEKKDLTRALAEWYKTMTTPPSLPPWIMVAFLVVVVYGPKVVDARAIAKAKKAAKKKEPKPEPQAQRPQRQPVAEDVKFTVIKNEEFGQEATDKKE